MDDKDDGQRGTCECCTRLLLVKSANSQRDRTFCVVEQESGHWLPIPKSGRIARSFFTNGVEPRGLVVFYNNIKLSFRK